MQQAGCFLQQGTEGAKWEADERPWHLAADVGQPNGCRWPAERLGLLKAAGIGLAAVQQQ